ncbi:hypothetical protein ES703_44978 [subsurface metagenome]
MRENSTEIELLKEISSKLGDLISIFAVQGKEKEEQIKIMVNNEYSNSKISKLLGIPKGTVDSIRASFKKK